MRVFADDYVFETESKSNVIELQNLKKSGALKRGAEKKLSTWWVIEKRKKCY